MTFPISRFIQWPNNQSLQLLCTSVLASKASSLSLALPFQCKLHGHAGSNCSQCLGYNLKFALFLHCYRICLHLVLVNRGRWSPNCSLRRHTRKLMFLTVLGFEVPHIMRQRARSKSSPNGPCFRRKRVCAHPPHILDLSAAAFTDHCKLLKQNCHSRQGLSVDRSTVL